MFFGSFISDVLCISSRIICKRASVSIKDIEEFLIRVTDFLI